MKLDYSITKTADGVLNENFALFHEFEDCVRGIEKVAGWSELCQNLERGTATVRGVVTGQGIEKNAAAKNLYSFMKEYCR